MKWLAILSVLTTVVTAVWKPLLAAWLWRQRGKNADLKNANEVRRRAQVVQEKHRDKIPDLSDDALDRRLRELRSKK
jgi:hypothetical protein